MYVAMDATTLPPTAAQWWRGAIPAMLVPYSGG